MPSCPSPPRDACRLCRDGQAQPHAAAGPRRSRRARALRRSATRSPQHHDQRAQTHAHGVRARGTHHGDDLLDAGPVCWGSAGPCCVAGGRRDRRERGGLAPVAGRIKKDRVHRAPPWRERVAQPSRRQATAPAPHSMARCWTGARRVAETRAHAGRRRNRPVAYAELDRTLRRRGLVGRPRDPIPGRSERRRTATLRHCGSSLVIDLPVGGPSADDAMPPSGSRAESLPRQGASFS
jgi:hypothetical protein